MYRIAWMLLLVLRIAPIAAADDFADYLPAKTLTYVSAENLARTRERAKKSPLFAMWNAPAMEGARREADRLGRKGAEDRIRASEFATLLQGRVCFASVPIGRTESADVVLVELKGDRAALLDMLGRARARNDGENVRTEDQEFRGFRITIYRELIEGEEEPATTLTFIKDDLYGYCDSLDVAKDIITRKEASEATGLSSLAAFQKAMASTGERCDVRFFVSASAWMRELLATDRLTRDIVALRLDVVNSVGGGFTLDEDGIRADMLVQHDGRLQGLLQLLANDIGDLGPPALVPPDSGQTITWAVDWSLLHAETMRIMAQRAPSLHEKVEAAIADAEKNLGLRLHEDLLAAFAPGTTVSLLKTLPPRAGEPSSFKDPGAPWWLFSRGAVVFQALRDKETIANLLAKLARMDGTPFKRAPYLGTTIYDGESAGFPSLALLGNRLVAGATPEALRILIRRQGKEFKGFRDTRTFKRAIERLPGKRSFLMVDPSRSEYDGWPFYFGPQPPKGDPMGASVYEAAPEAKWYRRYQGTSTLSLSRTEHGLLITSFWGLKIPESDQK